jgi:hypothetical protein
VRSTDLEAGEAVERAFQYQVRQRDRRLDRVADDVVEAAAALQPAAFFEFGAALRVDEN